MNGNRSKAIRMDVAVYSLNVGISILYVLEHVQQTRSGRCPRSARSQEYLSVYYISMCRYMCLVI